QLAPLLQEPVDLLPVPDSPPGEPLSFEECLRLALEHHPALKASRAQVLQARAQLGQILALYEPTLAVQASRVFQIVDTKATRAAGLDPETQLILNVSQNLIDLKRHDQVLGARCSLEAALYSYQSAWFQQYQSIQQAYADVLQGELQVAIQQANLQRAQLNRTVSAQFYQAGQKGLVDVTQAETQVAQARVSVVQAENQLVNLRLALARAVGVDRSLVDQRRLEDMLQVAPRPPDRDAALALLEQNPSLRSLEAQARSFYAQAWAQEEGNLPTMAANVEVGGDGIDAPTIPFWQFSVQLSVPLMTPGLDSAQEGLRAQAEQALHNRENTRQNLVQTMDTAYSDLQGADRRVTAAEEETRLALANFQLAHKRYTAGLTELSELINARSFVLSAQGDLVTALRDRKVAEGRLNSVTGQIPGGTPTLPDWDQPK
ncbi:MAG: TolC family protein, partial [Candidatus Eremiobacterota bacterium]